MRFLVSRTYSEVTPESAEDGVFSDTGFVFQDQEFTLRELIEYIKSEGFYSEGHGVCDWLTNGWDTICYVNDIGREDNLHVRLKVG